MKKPKKPKETNQIAKNVMMDFTCHLEATVNHANAHQLDQGAKFAIVEMANVFVGLTLPDTFATYALMVIVETSVNSKGNQVCNQNKPETYQSK